jgi:hypothetical protein
VVEAVLQSAATGKWVPIERTEKRDRPTEKQKYSKPPVHPPELVHAASPSGKH